MANTRLSVSGWTAPVCGQRDIAPEIAALDLEPVRTLLRTRGPRWTEIQCDLAESWYRRYLTLALAYPTAPLPPTPEIDEFWHQHILCTAKYAEDCDRVFGFFLHHAPRLDGADDDGQHTLRWTAEKLAEFSGDLGEETRRFREGGRSLASLIRD